MTMFNTTMTQPAYSNEIGQDISKNVLSIDVRNIPKGTKRDDVMNFKATHTVRLTYATGLTGTPIPNDCKFTLLIPTWTIIAWAALSYVRMFPSAEASMQMSPLRIAIHITEHIALCFHLRRPNSQRCIAESTVGRDGGTLAHLPTFPAAKMPTVALHALFWNTRYWTTALGARCCQIAGALLANIYVEACSAAIVARRALHKRSRFCNLLSTVSTRGLYGVSLQTTAALGMDNVGIQHRLFSSAVAANTPISTITVRVAQCQDRKHTKALTRNVLRGAFPAKYPVPICKVMAHAASTTLCLLQSLQIHNLFGATLTTRKPVGLTSVFMIKTNHCKSLEVTATQIVSWTYSIAHSCLQWILVACIEARQGARNQTAIVQPYQLWPGLLASDQGLLAP